MQSARVKSANDKVCNICCANLIKHVKCNHPWSDGHGPDNLVSNNLMVKNKGFLAERFIKPPVTVSFEFVCNVNVKYVVIGCKVGAQKSTGIEIFCQSPSTSVEQFDSVASGVLGNNNSGFVFHRHNENVNNLSLDQYVFRTFKSNRNLYSTKGLLLKIFRTSGTTVPALSKVEIWGIPCNYNHSNKTACENNITHYVKDECNTTHLNIPLHQSSKLSVPSVFKSFQSGDSKLNGLYKTTVLTSVPEDFIDPITCEIMTQPVIMPSGKIVDNTTLESYIKVEQQWGRGPSDPFTGVSFSISHKPIAAADLKVRIDKYLSENSTNPELLNIPRCLGGDFQSQCSKSNPSTVKVSKLVSNKCHSEVSGANNSVGSKQINTLEQISYNTEVNTSKTYELHSASGSKALNKNPGPLKRKQTLFQSNMDDSLEFALKSTLSKLPKLTDHKTYSNELNVMCQICKSPDNLFIIPCNHYVCRGCLISSKEKDQKTCSVCKMGFKSCDVQKIHL